MSKRQARIGLSLGRLTCHIRCDSKTNKGREAALSRRHCLLVLVSRYCEIVCLAKLCA